MRDKVKWGQRGEWYVVIQMILFALIFFSPFVLANSGQWPDPWGLISLGLGLILLLAGGAMALAGVISLGSNLTAVPYPKDEATLVERGAFRLVRHPIYSGLILGAFGWGFLFQSWLTLLLALGLFIFFDIKSRREEQWLSQKYADYSEYQARVRKLIPLIY